VVAHDAGELFEPPRAQGGEDFALVRDRGGQDVVVGADPVRGDDEDSIRSVLGRVQIADLAGVHVAPAGQLCSHSPSVPRFRYGTGTESWTCGRARGDPAWRSAPRRRGRRRFGRDRRRMVPGRHGPRGSDLYRWEALPAARGGGGGIPETS